MNIELVRVTKEEYPKLENIFQLYLHELSAYFKADFNNETCKYEYDLIKYLDNDNNISYFIKEDNNICGFLLIDIIENNTYEISETFIINNYKKRHLGTKAVTRIFNMYKGDWIIKTVPNSPVAEPFWTKVIEKYTNNNYKKIYTGKYNRAELYFNNLDIKDNS